MTNEALNLKESTEGYRRIFRFEREGKSVKIIIQSEK